MTASYPATSFPAAPSGQPIGSMISSYTMTSVVDAPARAGIVHPDSDGLPIAASTFRFEWVVKIKNGPGHLFIDEPDVFVAGDLFRYPEKEKERKGKGDGFI